MAIKRRFNAFSGIRFDIPHLRSIESAASYDFDSLLRGLVTGTNRPYLIRGFDVVIPTSAIKPTSLVVKVADSAVLHATATESGTVLTVPPGTADDVLEITNPKVIGVFQAGVPNYIALDYRRVADPSTNDQVSGWSPSQRIEYQRTAPLGKILDYRYVISSSGFGIHLPLYIVGVDGNGYIEYITKSTPSLFRLGSGGNTPNPQYSYDYKGLVNPQSGNRREWISNNPSAPNPMTVCPLDNTNAFRFGDWSITSLKEWMDAVMTRFREMTGSSYWYVDSAWNIGHGNLFDVWWDSSGSVLTGAGSITFNYVLQSTAPEHGKFQDKTHDHTIIVGDSYVIGTTTESRATLNSYNDTLLLIHSLTSTNFQFYPVREELLNRRIFRFNPAFWSLTTWKDITNTYAQLRRKPVSAQALKGITAISRSGQFLTAECAGHGFKSGDIVEITGIKMNDVIQEEAAVNSAQVIQSTTDDTLTFKVAVEVGESPTLGVTPGCRLDDHQSIRHPFSTDFGIKSWSIAGTTVTLVTDSHNVVAGQTITVYGLDNTANDAPNGEYVVTNITPERYVQYTASPVSGGGVVAGAHMSTHWSTGPSPDERLLTVSGAEPSEYNVVDAVVETLVNDGITLNYVIGPAALPPLGDAGGLIKFDGVVAIAKVNDPVRIKEIVNNDGTLEIETYSEHGLSTGTLTSFTIYGDPGICVYAQSYEGVDIEIVDPTNFKVKDGNPPSAGTFTNDGTKPIFVHSPDNPYPGPIQWDDDIIIKAVVGDRFFKIDADADADGTPTANQFNVGDVRGTAYLRDGEVCYVDLERNQSVSSGAFYSCSGGSPITGVAVPVNIYGNPLVAGDFVKFEDESENQWLRIHSIAGATINVVSGRGVPPTTEQRPSKTGRLVYCKGTFDRVHVKPHWQVPSSPDVFWLAVRRDNSGDVAKVYFRSLELEPGETRQINDQAPDNLLIYTGAKTESAINPNYTVIDQSGAYQYTQDIEINSVCTLTRTVSFDIAPQLGFQRDDVFVQGSTTYIVNEVISTKSVVVSADVSALSPGIVKYYRRNYQITDADNLTLAIRKENRELGKLNTVLSKTIYDESVYCQRIDLDGNGLVRSGDYIYLGTQTEPTALAWVLHGTANADEVIEGATKLMPGGDFGSDSILVHILSGTFPHGDTINQGGVSLSRTVDNSGNPPFPAPEIPGGIGIVLPPNRRTQTKSGNEYIVFPAHSTYSATADEVLSGESLLVIANDSIREAVLDYEEVFGGPKAQIRTVRNLPVHTRIRFRVLNNFGSPLATISGITTLQSAYDLGNSINTSGISRPVDLHAPGGDVALKVRGSIAVDGGGIIPGSVVGGIFPITDKAMLIGRESDRVLSTWTATSNIKTHDSHPQSEWVSKTSALTTGWGWDFSTVQGSGEFIPLNSVVRYTAAVVARGRTDPGSASFRIEATFKRESGSASLVGHPVTTVIGADGDGVNYAVTVGANLGNKIEVYVSGSHVEWAVSEDYQIVGSGT